MSQEKDLNRNILIIAVSVLIAIALLTCGKKANGTEYKIYGKVIDSSEDISRFMRVNTHTGSKRFPAVSITGVKDSTIVVITENDLWEEIGVFSLMERYDYAKHLPKNVVNNFKYLVVYPYHRLHIGNKLWCERREISLTQGILTAIDKRERFAVKIQGGQFYIYKRKS